MRLKNGNGLLGLRRARLDQFERQKPPAGDSFSIEPRGARVVELARIARGDVTIDIAVKPIEETGGIAEGADLALK